MITVRILTTGLAGAVAWHQWLDKKLAGFCMLTYAVSM
jgi:hypothetical protein